MKRRNFISKTALTGLGLSQLSGVRAASLTQSRTLPSELKQNINHSVCHWCFSGIPLEEFLQILVRLGISAVDLIGPEQWPLLKKYNIHSSMCSGAEISLTQGWNDPQYHAQLIENYTQMITLVAEAGYTNLICFSGNRNGMSDADGLRNCVGGLSQVIPLAEKHGVVLQMELFNQIDHTDYMCDSTQWGIALCQALGSEHFKLLYDIYHMQIQEGDIIRTIQQSHKYFGHYHTAGVPGRNEIDETQELYYPAIMRAIVAVGFNGYVAQEFVPKSADPIASLIKAFEICDV